MRDLSGGGSGGSFSCPQLNSDPVTPGDETLWVLRTGTGGSGGGEVKALFPFILTPNTGGGYAYELSYRSPDGVTLRTTLIP